MENNENNHNNNGQNNFGVPGGYFQKSAAGILNKIEWTEEHKTYKKLLELKNAECFSVPSGYFNTSQTKLELLDTATLFALPKKQPFNVPAAYFENAEANELAKVLTDNEYELAAFKNLNAIKKQVPFTVKPDYFANNEKLTYALLEQGKTARIVNLFFSRTALVAAALLMVAVGLWMYSTYMKPVVTTTDCGTIACVDKVDVIESKILNNLEDDDLYELVNPGDLQKKLENNNTKPATKKTDSTLQTIDTETLLDEI